MIAIEKITIKKKILVTDEDARINLKKLLADILDVNTQDIEMRFINREKPNENFKFKGGL